MITAYLGLGSNIGDREEFLRQAVQQLAQEKGVAILEVSSIYETEPVGFTEQASFLNAVVVLETVLSPIELLDKCLAIEKRLERKRELRWGPRTIDIDILLFGDQVLSLPQLTVPHPRMAERLFVLIPLKEVAGGLVWEGKTINDYIRQLPTSPAVKLYTSW